MAQMLRQQPFASVLGQGLAWGIESGCSSCPTGEPGGWSQCQPFPRLWRRAGEVIFIFCSCLIWSPCLAFQLGDLSVPAG